LDIALPFFNGYHWCGEIRKVSKVPIVFISSAADNMNIVMAMNMGGDDFIAKPFDLNVLMAKVQALLRRTYDFAGMTQILEHRGAMLNTADATLSYEG
ncbi:MAG TPA: response regulator, partial [Clostridia bacterium]|nr:response regulator [Clostridia bacterium]